MKLFNMEINFLFTFILYIYKNMYLILKLCCSKYIQYQGALRNCVKSVANDSSQEMKILVQLIGYMIYYKFRIFDPF